MKITRFIVGIVLALCAQLSARITTESLLDEMTDLQRLTRFPDPLYTTKQFSSYNRDSKTPDDPVGWFANADRGHYIREEQRDGHTEYVMMDADGPGAVVRLWSADPKGTLRIYLDNSEAPAIQEDMKALMSGDVAGFPKPLAGEAAKGFNLYFPIPYAKHCKVTSDQGKTYYHVNYRTYAPSTKVKTFQSADFKRLAKRVQKVAEAMTSSVKPNPFFFKIDADQVALEPGQDTDGPRLNMEGHSIDLKGSRVITVLRVTHLEAKDIAAAVRGIILSITFDDEETVSAPLGDFFGTAPGLNAYQSLPLLDGASAGSYPFSAWWMPFHKHARIRLINWSPDSVKFQIAVVSSSYDWNDRSLLFHAKWRIQRDLPVKPSGDWTHLACEGKGRFVGGELHVVNPVRRWWGEGDEKIYVDGETFPSTFGTGSEDYYGYAWCSPQLFTHPYHNQTRCDGPGNYGNTSVNRFHIIDDIPFTTQFKFDMENLHQSGYKNLGDITTTRDAISYWYARPGGKDFFKPITKEDVKPVEVPPMQPDRPQPNTDQKTTRPASSKK